MRRIVCWLAGVALGCGGTTTARTVEPAPLAAADCARIRSDAVAAEGRLESCRAGAPSPDWSHRDAFAWLAERIDGRLEVSRDGDVPETTILEAQEIAEHVWFLLDALGDEGTAERSSLDRTEDAAEGLLRAADDEARARALAVLASALGALRAAIEPLRASTCEREARAAAEARLRVIAECEEVDLSPPPPEPEGEEIQEILTEEGPDD